MKLHEYQGKELLNNEGVYIPDSRLAYFAEDAWMISSDLGYPVMLKAQVLAGGRGRSGGIKKCNSAEDVRLFSRQMFGSTISTRQTGSEELKIRKILVEKALEYEKEFYLSFVIDNKSASIALIISKEGGMDVEETAIKSPQLIKKIIINPYSGFLPFYARVIATFLEIESKAADLFSLLSKLYNIYMKKECTMMEINPLVLTLDGRIVPLDVKIDIDDNALVRHKEIVRLKDFSDMDEEELEARIYGLNFIKLSGNIGCMVNGAGLAMATMDFIMQAGGNPANFMDVGGVATPETIKHGFEILSRDRRLKAIFVNIFGGIVRCDKVAAGILEATESGKMSLPVIIRLSGSNVSEGWKMLKNVDERFFPVDSVEQARDIINRIVSF
jgi:succinyl-CoA synthetase beta subunit